MNLTDSAVSVQIPHQFIEDPVSSRNSSPTLDTSDDDSLGDIPSRGLGRFRDNDRSEHHTSTARLLEDNSITKFCTESLYSYSFSQINHPKASKNRRQMLVRSNDYVQRIRRKLSDRDPGRRFSQPDIGTIDKLRFHSSTWSTQNTPRTSIDYGNNKPCTDALSRHMQALRPHPGAASVGSSLSSGTSNYSKQAIESLETSLPPIQESSLSPSLSTSHIYADRYRKAQHVPTRFLPQNQAMVTTYADGTITLFNDVTYLCFGTDKSFIGKSLLDALEEPFRSQISYILDRRKQLLSLSCDMSVIPGKTVLGSGVVLVCGAIIPIVKANGDKSVASLWLKEKQTDSGNRVYIWIFEEIYESSVSVSIDDKGVITHISGEIRELYEYSELELKDQPISLLIPDLSQENPEARRTDQRVVQQERFCGSRSKSGVFFPTMIRHQCDNFSRHVLTIISLPSIGGLITVHANSGIIQSTNPVPSKYLFGYAPDALDGQMNVSCILPRFSAIVAGLRSRNALRVGEIVNPHTCREAISNQTERAESHSLPHVRAVHRDGSIFEVQLQLRLIESEGEEIISVWVTYDRIHALSRRNKRKVSADPSDLTCKADCCEKSDAVQKDTAKESEPRSHQSYQVFPFGEKRLSFKATGLASEDADLETPAALSDYMVVDTLGTGTYGTAKLAYRRDDEEQDKVVIKYIAKSRIIIDSWIRDRGVGILPSEIHIMRKLTQHPHINCCMLVNYLEDSDNYYVVMKAHGDGMDLFEYIELNEHMSEQEIRSIFRQVVAAVQHLHQLGIVHRDIKDENILLNDLGTVQLIDFGSAAYFKPGRTFDTFSGTLDYCAPEILKGTPYEGPPQDIWSLGILLYTLIYRETPFYNIDEILEHDLRIPSIPFPDPMKLLRCMLSREVKERPTIDEIVNDPWLSQS